jgi:taurine dioxygenase
MAMSDETIAELERHGIRLRPLDHIGAEIFDLDLERLNPAAESALNKAWIDHGVLLFRGQPRTAEAHIRLSQIFGTIEQHVVPSLRDPDEPLLAVLGGEGRRKDPAMVVNGEIVAGFLGQHQDSAYTPSVAIGSVLRMIRKPASGGDTMWVDMEEAYAALPDRLRRLCDHHQAIHIWRDWPDRLWGRPGLSARPARPDEGPFFLLDRQDFPPVVQPMTIRHPVSGKPTLLMSPLGFLAIAGVGRAEGEAFYEELARFVNRPEFGFRHQWAEGDMVLWDNRRTMHCAFGYPYADERIVQRTTLVGELPTGRALSPGEMFALLPAA